MDTTQEFTIPRFTSKLVHHFSSKVSFVFLQNSRRIEVFQSGMPKSVRDSDILCCNQTTDSPVRDASVSVDSLSVAVACRSGKGYLFPLTQNSSEKASELGNDVVALTFIDRDNLILANNQSFLYRVPRHNPSIREQMGVLKDCSINTIQSYSNLTLICATSGFFIQRWKDCFEKVLNMNCYSAAVAPPIVYVMSSDGIYSYDLESDDSTPVLLINIVDILTSLSDQIFTDARLQYHSGSLIVHSKRRVVSFSVQYGTANSSISCDNTIRGTTVSDTGELFLYTSTELFVLSRAEQCKPQEITDIAGQLKTIYSSDNVSLRFVETATILQNNINLAPILLPLLIEQYALLPEILIPEMTPLLVHHLTTSKCVKLEELYNAMKKYGKQGQIWRLLPAYDMRSRTFCLKHCDDFMISQDAAKTLIQCADPRDIPIPKVLARFPDLAADVYRATKGQADPFVLLQLDKFTPQQLKEINAASSGSGSLVESLTRESDCRIDANLLNDPFFVLDEAKRRNDSETVTQIMESLGLGSASKTESPHENEPDLGNLADALESASDLETFGDFSGMAKQIGRSLNSEASKLEQQHRESSATIEELALKSKTIIPHVTPTDKCSKCGRLLLGGKVVVYSCGHKFHVSCKNALFMEFEQIVMGLRRSRADISDGCPLCGVPSSLLVHQPVNAEKSRANVWALDKLSDM